MENRNRFPLSERTKRMFAEQDADKRKTYRRERRAWPHDEVVGTWEQVCDLDVRHWTYAVEEK